MFGIETLTGMPYAAAVLGVVLVEALALYVSYAALGRLGRAPLGRLLDREGRPPWNS